MTDLEILQAVRELLTDPAHWTQGAYARSGPVPEGCAPTYFANTVNIQDGVCWCVNGAAAKVQGHDLGGRHIMDRLLDACLPETITLPDGSLAKIKFDSDKFGASSAYWNDHVTHAEVLAALDCAIAKAIPSPEGNSHTGAHDGQ